MGRSRRRSLLLALAALAVSAACDVRPRAPEVIDQASTAVPVPAGAEPVVREILADLVDPPGAPGRRLTLVRYTIAPDARLPAHFHPGVQVAAIVSGTLTYQVIAGKATVQRAVAGNGAPRAVDELVGPAETVLTPGDAVIEPGDMVHFGANQTAEPVVIIATLITDPEQDLAVPASTGVLQ